MVWNLDVMFLLFTFQLCEDLFTKINDNTDNSMSYSVEVRLVMRPWKLVAVCSSPPAFNSTWDECFES